MQRCDTAAEPAGVFSSSVLSRGPMGQHVALILQLVGKGTGSNEFGRIPSVTALLFTVTRWFQEAHLMSLALVIAKKRCEGLTCEQMVQQFPEQVATQKIEMFYPSNHLCCVQCI